MKNIRVVVLKGNGKAFCSGLDLNDTSESFTSKIDEHGPEVSRKALKM
jgi:enoyl-CoA hydratase/carnithine racemase